MKFVAMLSLVLAGFAFAATDLGQLPNVETITPEIAGSDVICSQPFVFAALINGVGFSQPNSWMIADDFTYAQGGYIDLVEIWAIYTSGNATGFNIQLRADGGAGPGSIVSSHTSTAVAHTNTGLTSWGYNLWDSEITVGNIDFLAGTKYWFAMQSTGGAGAHYWLSANQTWADMTYFSANNGSSWSSSQAEFGAPYEQFMILSGSTALTRDSWGSIKTLF